VSTLHIELRQGGTLIAAVDSTITTDLATLPLALSDGERATITDFGALQAWITADGEQAKVTWVQLGTPVPIPVFPALTIAG
jgi:hypothetical protein